MTPLASPSLPRLIAGRLLDLWLPRACCLCATRLNGSEAGWCDDCRHALRGANLLRCAVCARAPGPGQRCACVAEGAGTRTLLRVGELPVHFDRSLVVADYAPPLDRLIVALKFQSDLGAGRSLGAALADWVAAQPAACLSAGPWPPVLLPVPLGPRRLRERGYNQSAVLAAGVARRLRWPLRLDWLRRPRDTVSQTRLGERDRRANLEEAFVASPRVGGRALVLVDDVMTTGATLAAAAQALRLAGAADITLLAVARTP